MRIEAIGVNFADTYYRTGLYKITLPFTTGSEAAGVVEAVGPEVIDVRPGERVAYAMHLGAYAKRGPASQTGWREADGAPPGYRRSGSRPARRRGAFTSSPLGPAGSCCR